MPSMVRPHAIGQFLSPAGRALSMATVHGGAGGGGLGGFCAPAATKAGSHCGGMALNPDWRVVEIGPFDPSSASLFATLGFVMCGMRAAQKAAATPMRTSARKREACFFAY